MDSLTQAPEKRKSLTLDDVKAMTQEMLTPAIVAKVIHCDPYYITLQAKADPDALGFPVSVCGSRTRIPRRAFIRWMEGGEAKNETI